MTIKNTLLSPKQVERHFAGITEQLEAIDNAAALAGDMSEWLLCHDDPPKAYTQAALSAILTGIKASAEIARWRADKLAERFALEWEGKL